MNFSSHLESKITVFAIQKFLRFVKTTHHLPNLLNLNFNNCESFKHPQTLPKRNQHQRFEGRKIELLVTFGIENRRVCD